VGDGGLLMFSNRSALRASHTHTLHTHDQASQTKSACDRATCQFAVAVHTHAAVHTLYRKRALWCVSHHSHVTHGCCLTLVGSRLPDWRLGHLEVMMGR
jgi:hypothetical protein